VLKQTQLLVAITMKESKKWSLVRNGSSEKLCGDPCNEQHQ